MIFAITGGSLITTGNPWIRSQQTGLNGKLSVCLGEWCHRPLRDTDDKVTPDFATATVVIVTVVSATATTSFCHLCCHHHRTNGWNVVTLKYGKKMEAAFKGPGGKYLRQWINDCDNELYSSLCFQGGKHFRARLLHDIGGEPGIAEHLEMYDDEALFEIMTNLGGHCFETIFEAFADNDGHDLSTCFIMYTIKGYGLPLAGHRDNHGLFMNDKQVKELQKMMVISEGDEWKLESGFKNPERVLQYAKGAPININAPRDLENQTPCVDIPDILPCKMAASMSTQGAFGQIMLELGRSKTEAADRMITFSPDVATSTNLGGFLNQRGVYGRQLKSDAAKEHKIQSMNKWDISPKGQHVELGIAENNLMLMLAAAGMSAPIFKQRLLPIGTLYDPFISRGACHFPSLPPFFPSLTPPPPPPSLPP
jgi:pyruvate dehydrogenase E1 component